MKIHKTSSLGLFFMVLVILLAMANGCSKRGGDTQLIPPEEAPVTTEEDGEAKLSVKTMPEVYSLTMSSTPGIRLGITMESKGEPDIQFNTESGRFLEFENGKVTDLGTEVKQKIAESGAIYWTPDKDTKSGDMVSVSLIDEEGKAIAYMNLSVVENNQEYSLEPSMTENPKE